MIAMCILNDLLNCVIVKETLNKKVIKNSVCVSPQEIVIPLLGAAYFREILYRYSQIAGLLKVCREYFIYM